MSRVVKNRDVFQAIEKWAPKNLAYDWDPIGLQVGTYDARVEKVMVTLDVMESVVDEAIQKNVDLIIAHHPMIFTPLRNINFDTPLGRTLLKLIKHDITVYAAHTNLDIAEGGVNDLLCDKLELSNQEYLIHKHTEQLYKVVVFVPLEYADAVRESMGNAGAGHIGNYSHCTFQAEGIGTFKPLGGTNPFIGKQNEMEYVSEYRLETIVPEVILKDVLQAMIAAHPYEEVAYDVIPLANEGKQFGLGRIATIESPMSFIQFAQQLTQKLQVDHLRFVGDEEKQIRKVAIIGGSGEKYIHDAKRKGADVLITGDVTFHVAQEAEQIGLTIIDAGHYIEKIMKEGLKNKLEQTFTSDGITFVVSETNTNPFKFLSSN